jgi:hypothetical protein
MAEARHMAVADTTNGKSGLILKTEKSEGRKSECGE